MLKVFLGNLAVWCCVAAVALMLLRTLPAPEASAGLPPLPAQPVLAPVEIAWPDASAFAEIGERPLFTTGRRPPQPVTPVTAPPNVPDITLVGLVGTREEHVAMAAVAGETLRLRTEDNVAGWSVIAIDEKSMTLRKGREEFRVWLGDPEDDPSGPEADEPRLTLTERRLATFGSSPQDQYGPDD